MGMDNDHVSGMILIICPSLCLFSGSSDLKDIVADLKLALLVQIEP